MARKTKEDAEKTRQLLLESALKLFSEKGPARVTLAEIAREAGATRGAIYWHFKDKDALLSTLWEEAIAPVENSFIELLETGSDDPLGELRELIEQFLVLLATDARNQQIYSLLQQSLHTLKDSEKESVEELRCTRLVSLAQFLESVEKEGGLKDGVNATIASLLIASGIDGMTNHHINSGTYEELAANARLYSQIYIDMVRKP